MFFRKGYENDHKYLLPFKVHLVNIFKWENIYLI